jgi:hypothetical protein
VSETVKGKNLQEGDANEHRPLVLFLGQIFKKGDLIGLAW